MSVTLLRQIRMLSLVPVLPRKTSVATLRMHLVGSGFDIHRRTVERDLLHLSRFFPLACDDHKPAGWSWSKDARLQQLPSMDPDTALALQMMKRYLQPLLPTPLLQHLQPQFGIAQRLLDEMAGSPQAQWPHRIASIPSGFSLRPPNIDESVQILVNRGVMEGLCLKADYRSLWSDSFQHFTIHPLGLVFCEGVLYLVATLWDYTDLRQLALHRMQHVVMLDTPVKRPPQFNLQTYIKQEHAFEYPSGKTIRLKLRVDDWLARHLKERQLSTDQKMTLTRDEDVYRVSATVAQTEQLLWWLRSLGDSVEVIRPVGLRRQIQKELCSTLEKYQAQ